LKNPKGVPAALAEPYGEFRQFDATISSITLLLDKTSPTLHGLSPLQADLRMPQNFTLLLHVVCKLITN